MRKEKILTGDVLTRDDVVRVVGHPHPLTRERVEFTVPAGVTIFDIMEQALKTRPTGIPRSVVAYVNDRPVPVEWWPRVRPKEGSLVTFFARPLGDNMGTILGIAVAIAAMIIAPYAAGALFATGTFAFTATQALVGGVIMLGGMMAINMLFPPRPPQIEDQKEGRPLFSLTGGTNQINKYGPIPAPLGEHRYYPPFGVTPYTEMHGRHQYLHVLVIWGIGRHDVKDIKIGETPLNEFDDYEIEHREGRDDDEPVTLIPKDVYEEQVGAELEVGTPASEDPVRVTQMDSDIVSIDVMAPEGIYRVNKDTGKKMIRETSVEFDYRLTGGSGWTTFGTITFLRELEPARAGLRFKLPVRGQYDIRANKIGASGDAENVADKIIWTVLRSIRNEPPITFHKPLCMTALRIRATEQLGGTLQTINGVVTPKVKSFDGDATWVPNTMSSWPPDMYRHVLQGAAQTRPKGDDEIDLASLEDWHDFCRIHNFKFKQVRDFVKGTWDVLADIAAAGAAVPIIRDGKWSIAWDKKSDLVKGHFTPRNAWALSYHRDFPEEVHAWRIPFLNEEKGFTEDEITVYDDGYNKSNATKFENLELPGVTSPAQIWKLGRRHIAQIRLRPDSISFTTDWESLACSRGDPIYLAYDTLRIGQTYGYIRGSGIDADSGSQSMDTDEWVVMEPGKEYAIRFRKSDTGESVLRSVIARTGEWRRVLVSGVDDLPAGGDLFMFGEADLVAGMFRVKEIENQDNLFARLTVVDDAPGVSDAAEGDIPPYESNISPPPNMFLVLPTNLQISEWIELTGADVRSIAKFSWQVPRTGVTVRYEVQIKDVDALGEWRNSQSIFPPKTNADIQIDAPGTWSFRVRAIYDAEGKKFSAWVALENIPMLGLLRPPDPIQSLRRTYVSGNSVLDWAEIQDPRSVRYEVRRGPDVDTAMTVADQLTQPRYATVGDGIYWVAGYVISSFGDRIYTANWVSVALEESVLVTNILVEHDEAAEGFTGTLEGGVVNLGVVVTDGSPIVSGWALEMLSDLEIVVTAEQRVAVYQSPHTVDIQRVTACPLGVTWDGAGAKVGASIFDENNLFDPPIEDWLGQATSRFIRIIPVVRFSLTSAAVDVFAEVDVFTPTDVYQGGAVWEKWRLFSPGELKGRLFQQGFIAISSDVEINAICPAFKWFVDVPDRLDHYSNLTIPAAGYSLVFTPDKTVIPAPFNGGPRGAALPHVGSLVINPTPGDEVRITDLTVDGCTVKVWNTVVAAFVLRSGVYVDAFGY